MEYLREQFDQELDDEGEVIIAGETFNRHDILNGLAPEPYRIAFNEWLDNRKARLLAKSEVILSHFDNAARFGQLSLAFRGGSMIPFVGAGLSVASGFPSWTKFLFQVCAESHVAEADLAAHLVNGNYEDAAELLYNDLGGALFNENVQSTFAAEKKTKGVINLLPSLFPNTSILTTNFDSLIETIFRGDGHEGFDRVQSGKVLSEVCRQMTGGSRLLVKMHGDCRQVRDRVLLKSEYEVAYVDASAVRLFFNQVMFGRSILFLGCSLSSDRTIKTMKELVTEYGSEKLPRHYAFLELREEDDRVARKKNLASANIFPIWYDEGDHDEALEALFLKLLQAK